MLSCGFSCVVFTYYIFMNKMNFLFSLRKEQIFIYFMRGYAEDNIVSSLFFLIGYTYSSDIYQINGFLISLWIKKYVKEITGLVPLFKILIWKRGFLKVFFYPFFEKVIKEVFITLTYIEYDLAFGRVFLNDRLQLKMFDIFSLLRIKFIKLKIKFVVSSSYLLSSYSSFDSKILLGTCSFNCPPIFYICPILKFKKKPFLFYLDEVFFSFLSISPPFFLFAGFLFSFFFCSSHRLIKKKLDFYGFFNFFSHKVKPCFLYYRINFLAFTLYINTVYRSIKCFFLLRINYRSLLWLSYLILFTSSNLLLKSKYKLFSLQEVLFVRGWRS